MPSRSKRNTSLLDRFGLSELTGVKPNEWCTSLVVAVGNQHRVGLEVERWRTRQTMALVRPMWCLSLHFLSSLLTSICPNAITAQMQLFDWPLVLDSCNANDSQRPCSRGLVVDRFLKEVCSKLWPSWPHGDSVSHLVTHRGANV